MANLTNLVGLFNELIPGAATLAQSRAKVDELRKFVYFDEGPSDQVAVTEVVHIGLPAAASVADRAAAIINTRASDVLTKTVNYTPFRTQAMYTDKEMNRIANSGVLGEVLADGLVKCWAQVIAGVTAQITGAIGTATIPNLSAGTDFLAATHTLATGGTYANNGTAVLDTAALQAAIDVMVKEQDWSGVYTNVRPQVLIAASAQKIHAAVASAYGSSALDANVGQGMAGVVLPGLGNFWAVSGGPSRQGLRVTFAAQGQFGPGGEPWVGMPYTDESGRIVIPFGCDFAAFAPTYLNLWVSNGTV